MGFYSRRDVSWLKWGFKGVAAAIDLLICPQCYATVPEYAIQMDNQKEDYTLPWMEHIFWHEEVQRNDFTFGWHFPLKWNDRKEQIMYLQMKREYKNNRTLPGDFLEAWYERTADHS
jgi:hypothetical protein